MYKIKIEQLKAFKKQLITSNEIIGKSPKSVNNTKVIKNNVKLIKIIENEFFID